MVAIAFLQFLSLTRGAALAAAAAIDNNYQHGGEPRINKFSQKSNAKKLKKNVHIFNCFIQFTEALFNLFH